MPIPLIGPAEVGNPKAKPPSDKDQPRTPEALEEAAENASEVQSLKQQEEMEPANANEALTTPTQDSDGSPETNKLSQDLEGMLTWVEIESILERMYHVLSRANLDVESVMVALQEMRRLQEKLKDAIKDHIEYHHVDIDDLDW